MRIEIRNLRKRFGSVSALAGVSLTVPTGRRVALIGPNGSGKSTLIRGIMGIVSCEGEILLDGQGPFEQRMELATRLAYVPQTAPQLGATVGEVVRAVARLRSLDATAIAATAAKLELRVDAVATQPVRALSGGMKQKLLIALALAAPASLFIMDEPTASLDARTREKFFALFHARAAGATLLLCSHRLEEVQHLVDHVVALDSGRVAFDGPVTSFLGARALSILEVYTSHAEQADWLRAQGFIMGARGSWAKTLPREEKMPLLKKVVRQFNGGLGNVVVRDLEALDVPPSEEG